jgi:hypothetical protein
MKTTGCESARLCRRIAAKSDGTLEPAIEYLVQRLCEPRERYLALRQIKQGAIDEIVSDPPSNAF